MNPPAEICSEGPYGVGLSGAWALHLGPSIWVPPVGSLKCGPSFLCGTLRLVWVPPVWGPLFCGGGPRSSVGPPFCVGALPPVWCSPVPSPPVRDPPSLRFDWLIMRECNVFVSVRVGKVQGLSGMKRAYIYVDIILL